MSANALHANAHHIRISQGKINAFLRFSFSSLDSQSDKSDNTIEEIAQSDYVCFLYISRVINSFDTMSEIYFLSKNEL